MLCSENTIALQMFVQFKSSILTAQENHLVELNNEMQESVCYSWPTHIDPWFRVGMSLV